MGHKKKSKKRTTEKKSRIPTIRLANEVDEVAAEMKKQNTPWRRFMMGLMFGAGTAIGASVVATIVIIILIQTLNAVGLGSLVDQAGLPTVQELQENQE